MVAEEWNRADEIKGQFEVAEFDRHGKRRSAVELMR